MTFTPMLATPAALDDVRPGDHLERKYDGVRALADVTAGRLLSRNGRDLSGRFPTIARALAGVAARAVLDGEITAAEHTGSEFQALTDSRATFYVFDLLALDGADLRGLPIEERRSRLEVVLAAAPERIEVAERLTMRAPDALEHARRSGWEGLVVKRAGSPYVGRRSSDWLKLKLKAGDEFVVIGYVPISNGSVAVGALLLAEREASGLRYVGKVGTGFDATTRHALVAQLDRTAIDDPPCDDAPDLDEVVWCEPAIVVEVEYLERTEDRMLRQPVFKRIREDKTPAECVREEPAPDVQLGTGALADEMFKAALEECGVAPPLIPVLARITRREEDMRKRVEFAGRILAAARMEAGDDDLPLYRLHGGERVKAADWFAAHDLRQVLSVAEAMAQYQTPEAPPPLPPPDLPSSTAGEVVVVEPARGRFPVVGWILLALAGFALVSSC